MCLLTFAWKTHPQYKLIFASNRDEFYKRNTAPAQYWDNAPNVLAGKDLEAGGTWMGINKNGRFTALTNYRDIENIKSQAPSRGQLTLDYLQGLEAPQPYLENIFGNIDAYNGFNLLAGTPEEIYYLSNYEHKIRKLEPGIYGLSNALLDSDWFKVNRLKTKFTEIIQQADFSTQTLLDTLQDTTKPSDDRVQQTGLPMDRERMLSSMFIESPTYGTCSSAIVLMDYNHQVSFVERVYNTGNGAVKEQNFSFKVG
ncbi:MAG TPA: hypothetical protein DCS93_37700 [Microscillaceae bacterium]|nr:hypothetical protein [Microscillaceae bacterium]